MVKQSTRPHQFWQDTASDEIHSAVFPGKNYFQENTEKQNFLCDILRLRRYVTYRKR